MRSRRFSSRTRVRGVLHTGSRKIRVRNRTQSSLLTTPGETLRALSHFSLFLRAFLIFGQISRHSDTHPLLSGCECNPMGCARTPSATLLELSGWGRELYRGVNRGREAHNALLCSLLQYFSAYSETSNPVSAQQLGLVQDSLHGLFLKVGRVAVFVQDALHHHFDLGTGAFAESPVDGDALLHLSDEFGSELASSSTTPVLRAQRSRPALLTHSACHFNFPFATAVYLVPPIHPRLLRAHAFPNLFSR